MMKFRKDEFNARQLEPPELCRDALAEHPEIACDHDIMDWRLTHAGYHHTRGNNACNSDMPDVYTDLIRHGDTHGMTRDTNNRTKDMAYLGEAIHRIWA